MTVECALRLIAGSFVLVSLALDTTQAPTGTSSRHLLA
jgi:hypothetical protein